MSGDVQCWPVCQRCQTACVRYLAPMGGWAWKQDCRCRKTFYTLEGMPDGKPFMVHPATAGWGAVLVLAVALILAVACCGLIIWRYESLRSDLRAACSEPGTIAGLDLSSFVPICLEVKP